jgi:hypothetical protein
MLPPASKNVLAIHIVKDDGIPTVSVNVNSKSSFIRFMTVSNSEILKKMVEGVKLN